MSVRELEDRSSGEIDKTRSARCISLQWPWTCHRGRFSSLELECVYELRWALLDQYGLKKLEVVGPAVEIEEVCNA